jgi:hypothetical protein
MVTIGCMDCLSTVRIAGLPLVDGFFTCPVCREDAGVEIADAAPLPDFAVVEKAITVRASNFYVYSNVAGACSLSLPTGGARTLRPVPTATRR